MDMEAHGGPNQAIAWFACLLTTGLTASFCFNVLSTLQVLLYLFLYLGLFLYLLLLLFLYLGLFLYLLLLFLYLGLFLYLLLLHFLYLGLFLYLLLLLFLYLLLLLFLYLGLFLYLLLLLFLYLGLCGALATDTVDSDPPRLGDLKATEAFIDSAEVVVVGFFESEESHGYKEMVDAAKRVDTVPAAICMEKEVWAELSISSDTIAIFRKADNHQENLVVSEAKKLEVDGLVNFIVINEVRFVTEYNQVTAVGLFNSEVKAHLLLLVNRGTKEFTELKEQLAALAPEFTGKLLFVLINGALKSNFRSLGYFGLKSGDLPRVGIYDGQSDMKWLLPQGDISSERVRGFCQAFLKGELKEEKQAGAEAKSEL
ncbi:Endoplasmic reticulum resident protein 27 [Merluccius polli]|uniref:Endoplasmic reticulum resident protein 27 n=1 Tax=Merluccius polli TaxID=89951 RepID=A0AA47M8R0_MERPO|nr:Endoplasmic reticulum resident protein 27 [Merluccius polli]